MRITAAFIFSFILMIDATISIADEISFRCKVKNEYLLTDEGKLEKPEKYFYIGSSFTIERSTGKIPSASFNSK